MLRQQKPCLVIFQGTKLHYVEQGDNTNKCILCLHDFGDFWYGWRNQLRGLCENFWVVALDLKGFGESEKPVFQGGYDEEVILEEIRAFILTIIEGHEDQKIILIGHGLGGKVAMGSDLINKGSLPKKREYINPFDLKEGGGQFENLIFK